MRIVSWNVNGLRAVYKKDAWQWLPDASPDIFCLQEIKAEEDQLPAAVARPDGFYSYFNSSRERKGYSGVALYSKEEPFDVDFDVLPKKFNTQGRLIQARFKEFVLLNVYFPNGGGGPEKLAYKLGFYDAFLEHIQSLTQAGESVIFCGDVNVAHEEIDIARPKENEKNTGFLPEERAWFDEVLAAGFTDTFRHFNPTKAEQYSWWDMKSRARDRNIGWRIDYFITSNDLIPRLKKANIHQNIFGSDHCPVSLELK